METKEDFLALLNRIKTDEEKADESDTFYPFTIKHINYYCNPNHTLHRFRQFKIKKKSGGSRQITAPYHKVYKLILRYTNVILKSLYTPSDYAMGFCEGRSVVDNASLHKGHNYVFNIDLKDFFPSIDQARVWKRLQLKPFGFPAAVANVIAGLCSMKEIRTVDGQEKEFYVLPQGSPVSPIITNMICDNLDRRLAGLAKRFGLTYSRYADDITFSSMHNVYQERGEFRKELQRIISDQRFVINEDKTRLQKRGSRQEVTGLIVSDKVNVSQKYIRDIRNLLYIWSRNGFTIAETKFLLKYKAEKGHIKKGNPGILDVLRGKLLYLKMVRGEDDSVYKRLNHQFLQLMASMKDGIKVNKYGITYFETYPISEFEKSIGMHITILHNDNGTRYAQFYLGKHSRIAKVHRNVSKDDETKKEILYISICQDKTQETFWLIHKDNVVKTFSEPSVDIDKLNEDLDTLLSQ